MKTKEQIINWLKEKNILAEYLENVLMSEENQDLNYLLTLGCSVISGAFIWNHTKQGNAFWEKIDDEFRRWYSSKTLPKTMEEYYKLYTSTGNEVYLNIWNIDSYANTEICINKETAQAFIALMQLVRVRDYYNDDWKPDWTDVRQNKYVINHRKEIETVCLIHQILAFKTENLAQEFLKNFSDLIQIAIDGDLI